MLPSDIPGSNVEAASMDAFVAIARDLAPNPVGDHPVGSSIVFRHERAFARAVGDNLHPAPCSPLEGAGCRFVRQGKASHEV